MEVNKQRVKNNIPYDLTLNILSKLPIKSLKRFRYVRKSWEKILDDSHFMSMHFENFIYINKNDDSRLLLRQEVPCTREDKLFWLSGDKYENKKILDWPAPFQEGSYRTSIFGSSVDGMICVCGGIINDAKVMLWNPTTEEVKVIPYGIIHAPDIYYMLTFHGFGYDHVADDYKVIQYVSSFRDMRNDYYEQLSFEAPFWRIYSLKNNCWKKLFIEMTPKSCGIAATSMYLNGACHWLAIEEHNGVRALEETFVSFDISSETFCATSFYYHGDRYANLVVLNGYVALILQFSETSCFDIIILGEVGIKESWVKLFTIGPVPFVEHPIGIGNNGDIIFKRKDGEIVYFNSIARVIEELGIKGVIGHKGIISSQTLIYK